MALGRSAEPVLAIVPSVPLRRRSLGADQLDDVAHDAGDVEVLRRVHGRDAGLLSSATSCSGMIPPTTTGALTPASCSASITAGISSRCEPDRIDRPITCTPSCSAEAAIWAGVRRMPS